MSVEGFRAIAGAGSAEGVDGVVMMAEKQDIMAAHPEGQRRFYKFRGGAYSNCNLFWIGRAHAFDAIESFRYGGQFAKRKKDAVRALGSDRSSSLRFGLVTLDGMFRHFSRRFGVNMRRVGGDRRPARHRRRQRAHPPRRRGDIGEAVKSSPSPDGEGDHVQHGGGVKAPDSGESRWTLCFLSAYPSTTLRVVPLPICDGEA